VERYVGNGFGHLEIIISIADTKKTVTNSSFFSYLKYYVYFPELPRVADGL
jgi:hypothetical protein